MNSRTDNCISSEGHTAKLGLVLCTVFIPCQVKTGLVSPGFLVNMRILEELTLCMIEFSTKGYTCFYNDVITLIFLVSCSLNII